MGIVAIHAGNVCLEVQRVLRSIVQAGIPGYGMGAGLVELREKVFSRYISIMTGEAVVRSDAKRQKALVGARIMWRMAIFAAVVRDRAVLGLRPGIGTTPVPGLGRSVMRSAGPSGCIMTFEADRRSDIVHDQEIAELIVVRIMTGRTL